MNDLTPEPGMTIRNSSNEVLVSLTNEELAHAMRWVAEQSKNWKPGEDA